MRSRDVSGFVAPNCPSAQRQLTEKKYDPPDRQFPERGNLTRVSPNARTKCNHTDSNQQRDKTMCHLQPDLESVHVRQTACIAPGVDLCQRGRACIWNPCAVCRCQIGGNFMELISISSRDRQKLVVASAITTSSARKACATHA